MSLNAELRRQLFPDAIEQYSCARSSRLDVRKLYPASVEIEIVCISQGLPTFLSEGHTGYHMIVREPDSYVMSLFRERLYSSQSTNFSLMYYFFIIDKMASRAR